MRDGVLYWICYEALAAAPKGEVLAAQEEHDMEIVGIGNSAVRRH